MAGTILIVENDEVENHPITRHLQAAGYEVRRVDDWEEAVSTARGLKPSLIVLDMTTPELDTWGFLGLTRVDASLARIPILVASLLNEHQRALDLGATECVVKPVGDDALVAAVQRQLGGEDAEADSGTASERAGPVLVIEDDSPAGDLIQVVLVAEGYSVVRATTATEALTLVQSERPGLVIVDLVLPGADGFSVVHALRSDPETAAVPIVVVTGKQLSRAERDWLYRNSDHLAEKGRFRPADLAAVVHRLFPTPAPAA